MKVKNIYLNSNTHDESKKKFNEKKCCSNLYAIRLHTFQKKKILKNKVFVLYYFLFINVFLIRYYRFVLVLTSGSRIGGAGSEGQWAMATPQTEKRGYVLATHPSLPPKQRSEGSYSHRKLSSG